MRIAVCDDEMIFASQVKECVENYYTSLDVLIDTFSSGEELLENIQKKQFNLVFLDIEMGGKDGLTVARELHELCTGLPIIFLTSHTELAMEGYEVEAFRFLAKPVEEAKLEAALKAFEKMQQRDSQITIVEDGVQRYLRCAEILYIKGENVYLNVFATETNYLVRKKMKELLTELPKDSFVQIHRSFIVNLRFVVSFDGKKISLSDGTELPVSKGNRDGFTQAMMRYMRERD
nr:response regulator transcription factor [Eubacterium sp.]